MAQLTTLFMDGDDQVVRLPANCHFDSGEVYICKDEATGDVIISKRPNTWDGFFERLDAFEVSDDFMSDRDNDKPQVRDLF